MFAFGFCFYLCFCFFISERMEDFMRNRLGTKELVFLLIASIEGRTNFL